MNVASRTQVGEISVAEDLTFSDLRDALAAGWSDYRAFPMGGLFFGLIFVLGGIGLSYFLLVSGEMVWAIPATAGFPLLAPFAAAGLYEISRRRMEGLPLTWKPVLGAIRAGDGQVAFMGMLAFVLFSFWVILAHTIFGMFMNEATMSGDILGTLLSLHGLAMLAIGTIAGAVVAWTLYMTTVISLPMLLDKEVDFITAMIVSMRVVRVNRAVMSLWACVIAVALVAAMLPAFLGLLLVLPVFGHATFHLYRRAVR